MKFMCLLLGARLRGRTATQRSWQGFWGRCSHKGSEKGAFFYGFFTVKKGSEKGSQKGCGRQFPEGA